MKIYKSNWWIVIRLLSDSNKKVVTKKKKAKKGKKEWINPLFNFYTLKYYCEW